MADTQYSLRFWPVVAMVALLAACATRPRVIPVYSHVPEVTSCGNAVTHPFLARPFTFAPDDTRGRGILVNIDDGAGEPVRDMRPGCLPLALRLNNPGAQKSENAEGQIGFDTKGHAIFATPEAGIAEIIRWVERRRREGKGSAFAMMSRYAPPDDCIGSVDKLPSGECPPDFPLNPTKEYAARIAAALGKGPMDDLGLGRHKCADERRAIRIFVEEIMTFESGAAFCEGRCGMTDALFNAAMEMAWGPEPEICQRN